MPARVEYVPHLREGTLRLIEQVHTVHREGGGEVALLDLLRLFDVDLPPQIVVEVRRRGGLSLVPTEGGRGRFSNTGRPVEMQQRVGPLRVTVRIPERVHGEYECGEGFLNLRFSRDGTLCARARVVLLTLERRLDAVRANREEVHIQIEGSEFDRHFRFDPPPPSRFRRT